MSHDWPAIRSWAHDNGIECPRTGKVPGRVVDAYYAANGEPPIEPQEDGDAFTITVEMPPAAADVIATIEQHLVEALFAAFEAGQAHERARILGALAVTA